MLVDGSLTSTDKNAQQGLDASVEFEQCLGQRGGLVKLVESIVAKEGSAYRRGTLHSFFVSSSNSRRFLLVEVNILTCLASSAGREENRNLQTSVARSSRDSSRFPRSPRQGGRGRLFPSLDWLRKVCSIAYDCIAIVTLVAGDDKLTRGRSNLSQGRTLGDFLADRGTLLCSGRPGHRRTSPRKFTVAWYRERTVRMATGHRGRDARSTAFRPCERGRRSVPLWHFEYADGRNELIVSLSCLSAEALVIAPGGEMVDVTMDGVFNSGAIATDPEQESRSFASMAVYKLRFDGEEGREHVDEVGEHWLGMSRDAGVLANLSALADCLGEPTCT